MHHYGGFIKPEVEITFQAFFFTFSYPNKINHDIT